MTAALWFLAGMVVGGIIATIFVAVVASGSREDAYQRGRAESAEALVLGENDQVILTTDSVIKPEQLEHIRAELEASRCRWVIIEGLRLAAVRRVPNCAPEGESYRGTE